MLQGSDAAVPGAPLLPADAAALGAADAAVLEAADEVAPAEALAAGDAELAPDELARADAVAELVPRAAGDPLARPVSVVLGVHAMAARSTDAISVVLMSPCLARHVPMTPRHVRCTTS